MKDLWAAVDIGGTKTAVGLYDAAFRKVAGCTLPTCPESGCRDLVARIQRAYVGLLRKNRLTAGCVRALGAACPGPLDLQGGRIVYIPTMGFRDEPLAAYLREALRLPVALQKDTSAAVLAETVFGQGRGLQTVVYITISTGVGCGLAIGGTLVDGSTCAAGELGHLCVERGGLPCACGGAGCLEAYASGTAIARRTTALLGRAVSAKEAFALYRQGDPAARAIIDEAADGLGYAIAAVYQLLDPDIVILGGSVTRDYDVLGPLLQKHAAAYRQPVPGRTARMAVSAFDGDQVLLGAAYLGKQSVAQP